MSSVSPTRKDGVKEKLHWMRPSRPLPFQGWTQAAMEKHLRQPRFPKFLLRQFLLLPSSLPTPIQTSGAQHTAKQWKALEDIKAAILKGDSVAELFKQLEQMEKDSAQESVFIRGVKYLHSLQVPVERFKLALDLAAPLTSLEPTTATVFGVVRSVTAIAISFSTADLAFAKQIGEMLEQLSYIDDCDTLGQKAHKGDIHKALVLVYQKLLEFYQAAFDILTRKGVKLIMRAVLDNGHLPAIVSDFLKYAELLRKLVEKATWEIVTDIKEMLYDREIARWLDSGRMSRQNQYHGYLQDVRADKACQFLLTDSKFINWYNAADSRHADSQQLLIIGEMGSGKTVAMAFLIDELRMRNQHQLPQPKVCYHYCQNDGTGRPIYIFSVLILSLLEQLPGLKREFFEWYKRTLVTGIEPAMNFKVLEDWLQRTLGELNRPLFFVINGIDECDKQSRNTILQSLRRLIQKNPRLKILLSSRPEQEILERLSGIGTIAIGTDTTRDVLIVKKAVENRLSDLPDEVKTLVTEQLSRWVQGGAIWTKMTVELIEVRGIGALGPMRTFLNGIPQPGELSELYANLLSRYTLDDPENRRLAITALEILAFTRRPLSILELAWATALGAAAEAVPTVEALSMLVDHRRVMRQIQPFIVQVDFSNLPKRQVKLVHQSVKEFIIMRLGPQSLPLSYSTLSTADHPVVQQRLQSMDRVMLDICTKYLLLHEINNVTLLTEEQLAMGEHPQDCDLFTDDHQRKDYDPFGSWSAHEEDMIHYDPIERGFGEFFVYASCHWVEHFGAIAEASLLPQLKDIELLCRANSTRLHNWIAQNSRPDCTILQRFEFDSTLYDPLRITSLYGSDAMFQHMLENSDLDSNAFLHVPNPAMGTAEQILRWGDLARLKPLWDSKIGHQIQNLDFFRLVIRQWSRSSGKNRPGWDAVSCLVATVLDHMVKGQWGNDLVIMAARAGCMPIIQPLMDHTQHNPGLRTELLGICRSENSTIGEAVLGNHIDVLEHLLAQEGIENHLHHRNCHGENVLHLASRICNPHVLKLLIPHLRDRVYEKDGQNDTVIMRIIMSPAASWDRCEAVEILLSEPRTGEGYWSKDEQQEALQLAARLGEEELCGILRRFGTDTT
ncbi:hypothetical protein V8F33_010226 [Rhypophila sp. PSN 637]